MRSRPRLSDLTFKPVPKHEDRWSAFYDMELLTPMIGGGTSSWQVDMEQPIRPESIKHHLRFWWRALQRPDTQKHELLRKESALWGDAKTNASTVRISVSYPNRIQDQDFPTIKLAPKQNKWCGCPRYALFPLVKKEVKLLPAGFQFLLKVEARAADQETIRQVLRLWVLFGGLGARTRRGAGSLFCEPLLKGITDTASLKNAIIPSDIKQSTAQTVSNGTALFPNLHGAMLGIGLVKQPQGTRVEGTRVWSELIEAFALMRRNQGVGRSQGRGRTRCPSPIILKAARFANGTNYRVCLILNCKIPDLKITRREGKDYDERMIDSQEHPKTHQGKQILSNDSTRETDAHRYLMKFLRERKLIDDPITLP